MPEQSDKIRNKLLATFREEAAEHLQALTEHLLAFEQDEPPSQAQEMLETIFRVFHTFKGAARSVGLRDIEALCQTCESMLSQLTRGGLPLTRPVLKQIQETVRRLAHAVEGQFSMDRMPQALEEELGERSIEPQQNSGIQTGTEMPGSIMTQGAPLSRIRVSTEQLDALVRQAEELLTNRLAAEQRVLDAQSLIELMVRFRRTLARSTEQTGNDIDSERTLSSSGSLHAVAELEKHARQLLHSLGNDHRALAHSTEELLTGLHEIRMLPLASILDVFPHMVSDLAQNSGKQVAWVTHGAEHAVDRRILELLKDPLIHLVRNAVDHGIESPAKRQRAGKKPKGQVVIRAILLEGGRLELCVEDDGGGVDSQAVREAAMRMRLLTPEAVVQLTDDQALNIIFRTGLSTSPVISKVSGHGVGLAIVKERVERLGGQVLVESRKELGTTIRITVPTSINVFRGLLVREAGHLFLLPTEEVERLVRVPSEVIGRVEGREALHWDSEPVLYARLSQLLGLPTPTQEPRSKVTCILVEADGQRAAFGVTEALGYREAVVKELQFPLLRVRNIVAGGLLGSSEIALILRPGDLIRTLRRSPQPKTATTGKHEPSTRPRILVVDDSITTRTMEKNLLETAGFQVQVAVDGVEAWTILKCQLFDLVVSDVDMPRMDGFELTARIRADSRLADLPIILVTALESREYKERGIEAGANAYVVKSSFDHSNLLDIIHRLV